MQTQKRLLKIATFASVIVILTSCTHVNDLDISIAETVKSNATTKLTVVRTGTGSGEWNIAETDGLTYYFNSYPPGNFDIEIVREKQNDYCHSSESNVVNDKIMRSELKRDMLIKEKEKGEITIAIACHKNIYRFFARDSVVSVQMIIEDSDNKVRDTAVFKIVRKPIAIGMQ